MSDSNSNDNKKDNPEEKPALPAIPVQKDPSEMTPEELLKYEEEQRVKKEYIAKYSEELKPIEEELKQILSEKYDVEINRLNMEFELVPTLDSIDYLNFLLDVKRKYDLEIDAAELPNFKTLADVVIIVHKGLEFKKNNPTPPKDSPDQQGSST